MEFILYPDKKNIQPIFLYYVAGYKGGKVILSPSYEGGKVTFPPSFTFPPSYEGGKVTLPPSVTFPPSYEGGKVNLFIAPAIG